MVELRTPEDGPLNKPTQDLLRILASQLPPLPNAPQPTVNCSSTDICLSAGRCSRLLGWLFLPEVPRLFFPQSFPRKSQLLVRQNLFLIWILHQHDPGRLCQRERRIEKEEDADLMTFACLWKAKRLFRGVGQEMTDGILPSRRTSCDRNNGRVQPGTEPPIFPGGYDAARRAI